MVQNERWSIFVMHYKKDKQVQTMEFVGSELQDAIERAKEWCLLKNYYHVHTTEKLFDIDSDILRLKENAAERKANGVVPGLMIKEKVGA